MGFFLKNFISEPLYCIGSLRSRIKLLLALAMAYVFPQWAVKAVFGYINLFAIWFSRKMEYMYRKGGNNAVVEPFWSAFS
jgi:hypothetical protein